MASAHSNFGILKRAAAIAGALSVAACSTNSGSASLSPNAPNLSSRAESSSPIQHIVFIIQENRSFNNLFLGYPGATTQSYGYDDKGDKITLGPQPLKTHWDLGHGLHSFFVDCDGQGSTPGTDCKMDGWNEQQNSLFQPKNAAYSYVPRSEIKPYWSLAKQYVLGDETFASNLDASFVSHQYAVAAFASRSFDGPSGYWGCEGGKDDQIPTLTAARAPGKRINVCFKNPTLAIEADHAKLSWRFYAGQIYGDGGLWSSYQSDNAIFNGPDWNAKVINPPAQVLADIDAGTLANITWIAPTYETSDHAGMWNDQGPAWVASIVDAIGKSKFWNSTAIFIMWDDWGGWFDPVPPVYEDYDGLGFRVPLIVVSPYAKQNSVTHVQYETASIPRFIEDNFGLAQMAASDARANDPANDAAAFDYGQPPRKFKKIAGSKPTAYWLKLDEATRNRGLPAGIIGDD